MTSAGRQLDASSADAHAASIYGDLFAAVKDAGVTVAASLPDDWVYPLLPLFDEDPAISHVRVSREPEIIGICSGAFFGGVRALGVMGATGFLACISEIVSLAIKQQIPVCLLVSLRGSILDHQVFQEIQSRKVLAIVDALGLRYLVLDRTEKLELIPHALQQSRLQKRPYILWLTKSLITGAVPE
ncbi:MAG: hypothetical protein ACRDOS_07820 [Gaiellaceae bacterium]